MRIHLTADHGGFELARRLEGALSGDHDIVGHGPDEFDDGDDYPLFVVRAAQAVVVDQDAGVDAFAVAVVGDLAGGLIVANKIPGARAVGAWSAAHVAGARDAVDVNVLVVDGAALEADALAAVEALVTTRFADSVDQARRVLHIDEYEASGTIEGWMIDRS